MEITSKTKKKQKKKSKKSTSLDKLRTIILNKVIDGDSASKVIEKLLIFSEESSRKPITLIINSYGGSVLDGLAIIDTIRSIKAPVRTLIIGKACSMAAFIFLAGDERAMTKNSYWMIHPMSCGTYDYFSFIKDRVKFEKELNVKLLELLKKYTKLTKKDLAKFEVGELWLNAVEAKEKGITDKVI